MCQRVLANASLFSSLQRFDEECAAQSQAAGCGCCGGALHSARYPRKPRGALVALGAGYDSRLSFCCAREGCRRRTTPPSVRFLGRRVYLGVVVVLVSAALHGPTRSRVKQLRERIGVSRRALERWRQWWVETFPRSAMWRSLRGQLATPAEQGRLPASLLERFAGDAEERLFALLRALGPITTSSGGGKTAM